MSRNNAAPILLSHVTRLALAAASLSGCASVRLLDDTEVDAGADTAAPTLDGAIGPGSGQSPPSKPPAPGGRPPSVAPEAAPDVETPDAGAPPWVAPEEPPEVPPESEPEDAPPDDAVPPAPQPEPPPDRSGPCEGLDFIGECQGTVLRYCDAGALVVWDCAWSLQSCGWVDANTGYDCGGNGQGPVDGGGGEDAPVPQPAPPGNCGTAAEARVVDLVNAARAATGRGALSCDGAAVQAAQLHSQDQCNMNNMSHTGSDGSDAGQRMERAGGRFAGWGENVAYGASTPEDVHDMWMNSPGHHANIMGSFSRIGVGLATCNGMYYWTEAFMD